MLVYIKHFLYCQKIRFITCTKCSLLFLRPFFIDFIWLRLSIKFIPIKNRKYGTNRLNTSKRDQRGTRKWPREHQGHCPKGICKDEGFVKTCLKTVSYFMVKSNTETSDILNLLVCQNMFSRWNILSIYSHQHVTFLLDWNKKKYLYTTSVCSVTTCFIVLSLTVQHIISILSPCKNVHLFFRMLKECPPCHKTPQTSSKAEQIFAQVSAAERG